MKKNLYFIFAIVILLAAVASPTINCSLCGKPITGKYVKFDDGSVYCMDCMQKYPHCFKCGKPSNATTTIDGKVVCRDCLTTLPRCDFCNKPLVGNYITYPELNMKLCNECAATVPRCDICNKPDKDLITVGSKHICRSCYAKSDFCYICGEPIKGEFMWFDGDNTKKYCESCVRAYPQCASCGAPVGKYGKKLEDGRVLCPDCYKAGVFQAATVSAIKQRILDYLASEFSMTLNHKVRYTLQGQDFIKQKSNGALGDLNGLFYCRNSDFQIYVLYGLRKKDLYQVIPHEIAHAWAMENCRDYLTQEESEGFAQWIAYYTLRHFGYKDFSESLLKGDNVYARGLRLMMDIERRHGRTAVFDSLKN